VAAGGVARGWDSEFVQRGVCCELDPIEVIASTHGDHCFATRRRHRPAECHRRRDCHSWHCRDAGRQRCRTGDRVTSCRRRMRREGAKPILHLDMHGSKRGLQLAGTLEIAPWARVVPKLQAINVATGNNLVVVAGVCFARDAILQIKISEACPVYMLIAPETEVTFGFLEDNTVPFYQKLFSSGDINKACLEHFRHPDEGVPLRAVSRCRAHQVHSPILQGEGRRCASRALAHRDFPGRQKTDTGQSAAGGRPTRSPSYGELATRGRATRPTAPMLRSPPVSSVAPLRSGKSLPSKWS
jgi:hypothetical protein